MNKAGKFLRTLALAILSGGSSATVYAAVMLIMAAKSHGVPPLEAAANNAPVFLQFSKVALGAALMLACGELLSFQKLEPRTKLETFRLVASILCIVCAASFALVIVPQMEHLLPEIKTVTEAHEHFQSLHKISQSVFGASILFAYVSLLLPVFKTESGARQTHVESKVLSS